MIQELIVLKVKKERINDFRIIRHNLEEKVRGALGFIRSGIEQSIDDETIFFDVTIWKSENDMLEFNKIFRELNYGVELKECIDGKPLFM